MPDITDDDSKAVKKIAEIEQQLQETKSELDRWLAAGSTPSNASELAQREQEGKVLTDRLQALATALQMQRCSPVSHCTSRNGSWPKLPPRR